jgi:hypothetical protein
MAVLKTPPKLTELSLPPGVGSPFFGDGRSMIPAARNSHHLSAQQGINKLWGVVEVLRKMLPSFFALNAKFPESIRTHCIEVASGCNKARVVLTTGNFNDVCLE